MWYSLSWNNVALLVVPTVSNLKTHATCLISVRQKHLLQQQCQARLLLQPEWIPHHSRYFVIAPLFMEDRTSSLELKHIAGDLMPKAGCSQLIAARGLAKMLFAAFVRRVFRSHRLLWSDATCFYRGCSMFAEISSVTNWRDGALVCGRAIFVCLCTL